MQNGYLSEQGALQAGSYGPGTEKSMKRTLITPFVLLALGACAADGTPLNGPTTAASVTPATAPATSQSIIATTPITETTVIAAAPAAPATPVAVAPTDIGQIVLVEPIAPISQRGGNALLSIGSVVLGAFIPGPWGSVAGVTAGQAGSYALSNVETNSARYHVRMADGTVQTFTQAGGLSLAVGTPVQILTLADGSRTLVQTSLPPATVATTPI